MADQTRCHEERSRTMAEQTTTTGTVVGRALIDRHGDIWRITPEGVRAPEADDHEIRDKQGEDHAWD